MKIQYVLFQRSLSRILSLWNTLSYGFPVFCLLVFNKLSSTDGNFPEGWRKEMRTKDSRTHTHTQKSIKRADGRSVFLLALFYVSVLIKCVFLFPNVPSYNVLTKSINFYTWKHTTNSIILVSHESITYRLNSLASFNVYAGINVKWNVTCWKSLCHVRAQEQRSNSKHDGLYYAVTWPNKCHFASLLLRRSDLKKSTNTVMQAK